VNAAASASLLANGLHGATAWASKHSGWHDGRGGRHDRRDGWSQANACSALGARTGSPTSAPNPEGLAVPLAHRGMAGHSAATRPSHAVERGCDAAAAELRLVCCPRDVVGMRRHAAAAGGEMDYDGAAQT